MGQICDLLKSVSVHFGSPIRNVPKFILKSPRFVPFGANLSDPIWMPILTALSTTRDSQRFPMPLMWRNITVWRVHWQFSLDKDGALFCCVMIMLFSISSWVMKRRMCSIDILMLTFHCLTCLKTTESKTPYYHWFLPKCSQVV